MKTITIDVTADDIKSGVKTSASRCPVALAMRRALGATVAVSGPDVVVLSVNAYDAVQNTRLNLPDEVLTFVETFDDEGEPWATPGAKAVPFTFTLDVPDGIAP